MTLHVGFDGLTITARPAGIGSVARHLLGAIAGAPGDHRITAVLPRGSAADGDLPEAAAAEVIRAPLDGPDTPRALLYQHLRMPRLLERAGAEVLLGPAFVLPVFRLRLPAAVIFYDLSWQRFPETKTRRFRAYMDRVVPVALRRARAVIVLSRFAGEEARQLVPDLPEDRVHLVPPGVPHRAPPDDVDAALARLGVRPPFLLTVSNFDPRKNLPLLVATWRRMRAVGLPHALVLVGNPAGARDLREELGVSATEPLVTPGYVTDADLGALYAATDLVVVPSLYEGYGLPMVEAFAAGAPVACARAGSLPEVAGDAAILFDPRDEASVETAVTAALTPGEAREARVRRGRDLAARHTWDRAAERVLDILGRIA